MWVLARDLCARIVSRMKLMGVAYVTSVESVWPLPPVSRRPSRSTTAELESPGQEKGPELLSYGRTPTPWNPRQLPGRCSNERRFCALFFREGDIISEDAIEDPDTPLADELVYTHLPGGATYQVVGRGWRRRRSPSQRLRLSKLQDFDAWHAVVVIRFRIAHLLRDRALERQEPVESYLRWVEVLRM